MSETCYVCEGTGGLQRLTDRSRIKCPMCEGEGHQARQGDRFVSAGEVRLLERIEDLEQQLVVLQEGLLVERRIARTDYDAVAEQLAASQAEVARLREALEKIAYQNIGYYAGVVARSALATPGKGEE